jgi:hypothetical protein
MLRLLRYLDIDQLLATRPGVVAPGLDLWRPGTGLGGAEARLTGRKDGPMVDHIFFFGRGLPSGKLT